MKMIFFLVLWLSSTCVSIACPQYERNYLLDFKEDVPDQYNRLRSWQGFNCCEWNGVSHDLGSHVTQLDFSFFYLAGEIHPSLFKLEYLEHLDLRGNSFAKIPSDIGKLRRLTFLRLTAENFYRRLQIPRFASWLQSLTRLEYLSLGRVDISPSEASSEWGEVVSTLSDLTYLRMYDCGLAGPLPPSIANLSKLVRLSLQSNYLTGVIPPSLGNLSALVYLELIGNQLNGSIPSAISKLVGLETLSLNSNSLSGPISLSSFDNLTRLEYLDLSYNQLYVSIASTWIPKFESLVHLKLASCNLVQIPSFLAKQFNLKWLDLSRNNMLGSIIPTWIWDLPELAYLNLSSNQLTGSLPSRLTSKGLHYLDLHNNSLQGAVPLALPSEILLVDMSDNQFTSSIPSDIGEYLQVASFLSLSGNNITGKIPNSIWNNFVEVLDLSNNMLSGIVSPNLVADSSRLRVLNLGNNRLQGHMPGFQNFKWLQTLNLNRNLLRGPITSSLANCSSLNVVDIGNNNLEGDIPEWIGNLPDLQILILKSNKFEGNIPEQIIGLKKLQILDLSQNNLSGFIPTGLTKLSAMVNASQISPEQLGYQSPHGGYYKTQVTVSTKDMQLSYETVLTILKFMDLSSNNLWGKIPPEMGSLQGLKGLNLSRNHLSGEIPKTLGGMVQLESLDLSMNKLNGKIPMELQSLSYLQVLNVSYNMLEGEVPQGGQFLTFDESSFAGNPHLSDIPFTNMSCNCTSPFTTRACDRSSCNGNDGESSEEGEETIDWWVLGVGLCYAFGFNLVIGLLVLNLKVRKAVFRTYDRIIVRILPGGGLIEHCIQEPFLGESSQSFACMNPPLGESSHSSADANPSSGEGSPTNFAFM